VTNSPLNPGVGNYLIGIFYDSDRALHDNTIVVAERCLIPSPIAVVSL